MPQLSLAFPPARGLPRDTPRAAECHVFSLRSDRGRDRALTADQLRARAVSRSALRAAAGSRAGARRSDGRVRSLSRMKSFVARFARAVNRALRRSGPVMADRYHARLSRSPREARRAMAYVLLNARRPAAKLGRVASAASILDSASSSRWFDGWRSPIAPARDAPAVAAARTWLLAIGWRRHGRIDPAEMPGGQESLRRRSSAWRLQRAIKRCERSSWIGSASGSPSILCGAPEAEPPGRRSRSADVRGSDPSYGRRATIHASRPSPSSASERYSARRSSPWPARSRLCSKRMRISWQRRPTASSPT